MKKIFIFGFLLIFVISFISAQESTFKQGECLTILDFKDDIIGTTIPSQIPISTEIVNIYFGDENYGFISLKEKVIDDFGCNENENATYDLIIESEQVLTDILDSASPLDVFLEKFNNKEINLKGKTFGKKIKASFIKMGLRVFSWFN